MINIKAWDRPFIPQNELTDRIIADGHADKLKAIESKTERTFKKYGLRAAIFNIYCSLMYDYLEVTEE